MLKASMAPSLLENQLSVFWPCGSKPEEQWEEMNIYKQEDEGSLCIKASLNIFALNIRYVAGH